MLSALWESFHYIFTQFHKLSVSHCYRHRKKRDVKGLGWDHVVKGQGRTSSPSPNSRTDTRNRLALKFLSGSPLLIPMLKCHVHGLQNSRHPPIPWILVLLKRDKSGIKKEVRSYFIALLFKFLQWRSMAGGAKPALPSAACREWDGLPPAFFFICIFYSSPLAHEIGTIRIMSGRTRIQTLAHWLQGHALKCLDR